MGGVCFQWIEMTSNHRWFCLRKSLTPNRYGKKHLRRLFYYMGIRTVFFYLVTLWSDSIFIAVVFSLPLLKYCTDIWLKYSQFKILLVSNWNISSGTRKEYSDPTKYCPIDFPLCTPLYPRWIWVTFHRYIKPWLVMLLQMCSSPIVLFKIRQHW